MAMAAMNMVSTGVFGGKLSFKEVYARGRLFTLQENPHFRLPTIKVRPPDGNLRLDPANRSPRTRNYTKL
jgi:hypothetical protein